MKVYPMNGKHPLREIDHIRELLGDLWRGFYPYDPEHTDQDTTIVLHLLNEEEKKQNTEMLLNDIRPSLLIQRWNQVAEILKRDGYEVQED